MRFFLGSEQNAGNLNSYDEFMLKKWLNNPVVVGILVLLALAFVLRDFLNFSAIFGGHESRSPTKVAAPMPPPPLMSDQSPRPRSTATVASVNRSSATDVKHAVSAQSHSDWVAVGAEPLAGRDPFAPAVVAVTGVKKSAVVADQAPVDEVAMPDLTLHAIVSAQESHYASINDQLVGLGDTVKEWKVAAIGINRVQLRSARGLLTLHIDGTARLGGKPLKRQSIKQQVKQPKLAVQGEGTSKATAAPGSVRLPASASDLNIYQGLYDSLIQSGVVPNLPSVK